MAHQPRMVQPSFSGRVTVVRISSGGWKPSARVIDSWRATAASAWMSRDGRLTTAPAFFSGSVMAMRTRRGSYGPGKERRRVARGVEMNRVLPLWSEGDWRCELRAAMSARAWLKIDPQ